MRASLSSVVVAAALCFCDGKVFTAEPRKIVQLPHVDFECADATFSRDNRYVVGGGKVWELPSGKEVAAKGDRNAAILLGRDAHPLEVRWYSPQLSIADVLTRSLGEHLQRLGFGDRVHEQATLLRFRVTH